MASGRIRRTARRGLAAAALAWVGVAGLSVLLAPTASASAAVTVTIRDLTPPVVSVDQGGTVTFVNAIQDKTVRVGGGGLVPRLVDVTAKTEVTLGLPSGSKPLAPGASVSEKFGGTCATCTITYTYKYSSKAALTQPVIDAARKLLPGLPTPTPFVVNTILPNLPNPPSVNLPALPALAPPSAPPTPPTPRTPEPTGPNTPPPADPAPAKAPSAGQGNIYAYDTGPAPRLMPAARAAAAAFDPTRFAAPGSSAGGAGNGGSGGAGGAGGAPGGYDGAAVPVFGQLAGLDTAVKDKNGVTDAAASRSDVPALPAAALAAVVALATVTAALVRTNQARRASAGRHSAG